MPNMNNFGVKCWYTKTKPSKLFFSDVHALVSLENMSFNPLLHKSYTASQNNSSGMKCSDEFGEHAHQN